MSDSVPYKTFVILSDVQEREIEGRPMFINVVDICPNFGGECHRLADIPACNTLDEALNSGREYGKRWVNQRLATEAG